MSIEEQAKALGRQIGQSSEYQAMKRASEALNEDRETVTLLTEMEQQLDGLLGQIQGKMSYQRLVAAQENFDKVMARVNDWILEGMEKGAASPIITLS